ncbi:A disintegrin and metalloproteinase with thrombospondin motifs adt-1-like, partial [Anneissia japonica]|uniref:A disintegrin and metalloproteinase with thrombospondin motifs adt-1-like n=1 Tax=Anneissia japonica TaxID=1529436 RepID=UPI0014257D5C
MAWWRTALFIIYLPLLVLHEGVSPLQFPSRDYIFTCVWTLSEGECNHECGNSGMKLLTPEMEIRKLYRRRPLFYDQVPKWCTRADKPATKEVPCNRFCYNNGSPMDGFCKCHSPYSGKCCSECTAKDCLFSEWESWSDCVSDCGGYRTRSRNVIREAQCGGSPCSDKTTEELKCEPICLNGGNLLAGQCQCVTPYSGDCCESCHAVDCKWSEWNEWTICEPSCGGSRQRTRVREELNPAVCGGGACVGSNTEYKDCESICYNGQVSAEGHCVCQDDYTGLCCEVCMPLNCSWGSWNEWSTCEPACGNNRHRTRQRILEGQSRCGGTCSGLPEESETCDMLCQNNGSPMDGYCSCASPFSGNCCENCTLMDCKWSSWGYWSACNPECGAVRNRSRTMFIARNSQCGGAKCGPQPSEIASCPPICSHGGTPVGNVCNCIPSYTGDCCELCVAIDCVWSDWSAWSSCEPECGPKRIQTRTRTILTPEWCGGLGCSGETTQNQTCSPVCFNGGTPTNSTCDCRPWFRGECCGSCQPSDCHWEEWQEWSSCHPLCGTNRQKTRIRTILAHATCDGLCPGSDKDSMICNDTCEHNGTPMNGYCSCQEPYSGQCCEKCIPTDCELTAWNQWSGCSPDCGVNRTRTRTRSVDREAECGGLDCEASLVEQESCSSLCYHGGVAEDDGCQCHTPYTGDCCESCEAVDCMWTEWSSWSSCLPVCGDNRLQSRARFVKIPNYCGGQCVGNNTSTRPCESVCFNGGKPISASTCQCPTPYTGACCETCISINCTWGPWGDWSSCQPKCGSTRQRQRIRIMEKQPVCGGTCTDSPTDIEDCESLCYNKGTPMHGHCLCPFPFSPISCCKSTTGDPCIYHSLLNNPWRSVGNSEIFNSSCDTGLNSETWYRFRSAGGDQMTESCATVNTCGVKFPMWLNGKHPTTPGQNVERQACVSASKDGVTKCCEHKTIVTIRKCSDFFVYQFHATRTCEEGYCIGKESPCPSGTTSVNGYTPKCVAPPPKMDKQPQLYLEETSSGFYLLCVFEYPDHQNVSFDVIWSSEKDELHRETLFESRNATLPGEMIDVN